MKKTGKTSTFTVHHDTCKPSEWTAKDLLQFDHFVRTGSLEKAAHLARLGMQLVLSEHHVAAGGTIEEMGFVLAKNIQSAAAEATDDLGEIMEDDIEEVVRIYRGPTEYAARIPIGDEEGNFEGHEYEVKATLAEAQAYFVEDEKEATK